MLLAHYSLSRLVTVISSRVVTRIPLSLEWTTVPPRHPVRDAVSILLDGPEEADLRARIATRTELLLNDPSGLRRVELCASEQGGHDGTLKRSSELGVDPGSKIDTDPVRHGLHTMRYHIPHANYDPIDACRRPAAPDP